MATETTQFQAKSLDVPEQSRSLGGKMRVDFVQLGDLTVGRGNAQPGFRWTEHAKPVVGTDLCQVHHIGYVLSGRCGVRMADGTERELAAGDAFDVPPGHDMWVIGDEPYVTLDFALK